MNLRIVAGTLRRRIIHVPDSVKNLRPTLERVREAAAESIRKRIPGAWVVDLCAGSGVFGFEMISRGAAMAYFIERNPHLTALIRRQAHAFRVEERCRIITGDARRVWRKIDRTADIIFFDPPYNDPSLRDIKPLLHFLSPDGIFLYQRGRRRPDLSPISLPPEFTVRTRRYGNTCIDFIERTGA